MPNAESRIKPGSKIAIVCRGGPENGPFSAQTLMTLREGLEGHGIEIAGIYAVSGSCPTALLGCIRDEERLCDIWRSLTPQDIVGNLGAEVSTSLPIHGLSARTKKLSRKISRWLSIMRNIRNHGYAFSNLFLLDLLYKHCGKDCLDKIFSPEAALTKVAAVDYLTAKKILFSNRTPEHRKIFLLGMVASMGLVPWFDAITIDDPVGCKLIDEPHPDFNSVLLIDGGYRGSLLLEEAIREPIGYDAIFIIDIHGLEIKKLSHSNPNVADRIERIANIASSTNDQLMLSLKERIDEGIEIKRQLKAIAAKSSPEIAGELNAVTERMDNGRLRLVDKYDPQLVVVSNPERYAPFDFTKFKQIEVIRLLQAGHNAAIRTLHQLGFSTQGIPIIRP